MVLYNLETMRPDGTFITNRLVVYKIDSSTFEQYISPYANKCTLYPSDKGYDYEQGTVTSDVFITEDIVKVDWDNDYADFSGSCNIEIPYNLDCFEYLHRGAYTELYVNRFPYGTDVKYLRQLDAENYQKNNELSKKDAEEFNKQNKENIGRTELFHPLYNFYIEQSFKGFITDITYDELTIKLTLQNYGALLEEKASMSFTDNYRSNILYEVIHTAGLIPNMDLDGLPDEVISWSSSPQSNNDTGNDGNAITGDDCTPTQTMSCLNGCSSSNKYGSGHNFDDCYTKGYAVADTEYYKWARQFSSGEEMLRNLRKIWSYHHPLYYNNRTCPQALFNTTHFSSNCYDAARMVKVLCDSIGYPCVVVTGNAYGYGHGWNVIKKDGQWLSFDLCFGIHANASSSTNMSMIF